MQLYLIRHPRPAVGPDVCYGRSDVPLLAADDVAAIIDAAAGLPRALPCYSSPLRRCRRLAEPLAARLGSTLCIEPRLREIDFGDWELRPWADIGPTALDAWAAAPLDHAPPGGESVRALYGRVRAVLDELRGAGHGAVLWVTHAGVMKVVAGLARGLPETEWMALRFDYGALVEVTV